MIVDITTFDEYTGNHEDSTGAVALKTNYLQSAEEIVINYLGFDPTASNTSHEEIISGIGINKVYTRHKPINQVVSIKVNGVELTPADYVAEGDSIRLASGVFPVGIDNVVASFKSGWTSQNMPSVIKMTIMQIASLMLQESNGNIGVTGKSFGDNSRSFVNYTNYDKWLAKLDGLKVVRL